MKRGPQNEVSNGLLKKARNFLWSLLFTENHPAENPDAENHIEAISLDLLAYILHLASEYEVRAETLGTVSHRFRNAYAMRVSRVVGLNQDQFKRALVKQQDEINYLLANKRNILIKIKTYHIDFSKPVTRLLEKLEKCSKINDIIAFQKREKMLNYLNRYMIVPSTIGTSALFPLDLSNCYLTRFPSSVLTVTWPSFYWLRLPELNLSGNRLAQLPAEFGRLVGLRRLDLTANQLSDLPEEMNQLTALEVLHLEHNQFRVLPAQICLLPAVRSLYLIGNPLTSLPNNLREEVLHCSDQYRNWRITKIQLPIQAQPQGQDIEQEPTKKRKRSMRAS